MKPDAPPPSLKGFASEDCAFDRKRLSWGGYDEPPALVDERVASRRSVVNRYLDPEGAWASAGLGPCME